MNLQLMIVCSALAICCAFALIELMMIFSLTNQVTRLQKSVNKLDTDMRDEMKTVREKQETRVPVARPQVSRTYTYDIPVLVPQGKTVEPTVRGQIIRMHRMGVAPGQIAGALGVRKSDVDLLLKTHQVAVQAFEGEPVLTRKIG